jgi:hypothetical protein
LNIGSYMPEITVNESEAVRRETGQVNAEA